MKIAAIILAAGASARMDDQHKLLLPVAGRPMLATTVQAHISAGVAPIIIVTGYLRDEIEAALRALDVQAVFNPDWQDGKSTSIRTGIKALPAGVQGVFVALGDMPLVTAAILAQLVEAFEAADGERIVYPVHNARQGNPALFPAGRFPDLVQLSGEHGGKFLLDEQADKALPVDVSSPAIHMDCDTMDDYRRIKDAAGL